MDVFVYGALTEPARVRDLLESFAFVGAATLTGLRVVEGRYPTLAPPASTDDSPTPFPPPASTRSPAADAAVGGRLLRTEAVDTLDDYEHVDDGLYTRVSVPLNGPDGDPEGEAAVYVGDPDRLDADAAWPGSGSFAERVRRGVRERDVEVRRRPER